MLEEKYTHGGNDADSGVQRYLVDGMSSFFKYASSTFFFHLENQRATIVQHSVEAFKPEYVVSIIRWILR